MGLARPQPSTLVAFHGVDETNAGVGRDGEAKFHHAVAKPLVWMGALGDSPLAAITFDSFADERGGGAGSAVGNDYLYLSGAVECGQVRHGFTV